MLSATESRLSGSLENGYDEFFIDKVDSRKTQKRVTTGFCRHPVPVRSPFWEMASQKLDWAETGSRLSMFDRQYARRRGICRCRSPRAWSPWRRKSIPSPHGAAAASLRHPATDRCLLVRCNHKPIPSKSEAARKSLNNDSRVNVGSTRSPNSDWAAVSFRTSRSYS
jgi:hypothetical protein